MSRSLFSIGNTATFEVGGRELDGTVAVVDYRRAHEIVVQEAQLIV